MSNSKISVLTSATTPLAGTETLPVVQSSATTKVTVANLTAGRAVSAASLSLTTTPLPVSSGGTGLSTLTAGRIPFGATATTLSSASVLFWDNTNTRLGVGTGSPSQTLSVVGASFTGAAFNGQSYGDSTERLRIGYKDGTPDTGLVPAQIIESTVQLHIASRDNANGAILFYSGTGVVERMRIAGTGDITVSTGNVIQGTAAKGFDFSANTPLAGKTSTILNWYEEGTWTPNQGAGLTLVGAFSSTGRYTRIGRQVSISGTVTGATSVAVTAAGVITSNLPFTVVTAGHGDATNAAVTASATVICTGTSVTAAAAIAATGTITFSATYFV